MSPEVDLLERLSAEDATLWDVACGSCYTFRNLDHARNVVAIYIQGGVVEMYDGQSAAPTVIPYWEAKPILLEDGNWKKGGRYMLRLTKAGYTKFMDDSRDFFDELFSQRGRPTE